MIFPLYIYMTMRTDASSHPAPAIVMLQGGNRLDFASIVRWERLAPTEGSKIFYLIKKIFGEDFVVILSGAKRKNRTTINWLFIGSELL